MEAAGGSQCQAWHSCTSKAAPSRQRPPSLSLPRPSLSLSRSPCALIPHYLHSRQPPLLLSLSCFSHSGVQFGSKVDMLHHFSRRLDKSSRHCSAPIIFFSPRQGAGRPKSLSVMYFPPCSFFFAACFLISGMDARTAPEPK